MKKFLLGFITFISIMLLCTSCFRTDFGTHKSTFFFTIDKWVHWRDKGNPFGEYEINHSPSGTLGISVYKLTSLSGTAQMLGFLINNFKPTGLGEYTLSESNQAFFVAKMNTNSVSNDNDRYFTNANCTGILNITKFDLNTNKISGTFNFEAVYLADPNSAPSFDYTRKITIADGHFEDADFY